MKLKHDAWGGGRGRAWGGCGYGDGGGYQGDGNGQGGGARGDGYGARDATTANPTKRPVIAEQGDR